MYCGVFRPVSQASASAPATSHHICSESGQSGAMRGATSRVPLSPFANCSLHQHDVEFPQVGGARGGCGLKGLLANPLSIRVFIFRRTTEAGFGGARDGQEVSVESERGRRSSLHMVHLAARLVQLFLRPLGGISSRMEEAFGHGRLAAQLCKVRWRSKSPGIRTADFARGQLS